MADTSRSWKCKVCNGTGWEGTKSPDGYLYPCRGNGKTQGCFEGTIKTPDDQTLELAAKWADELDAAERKVDHFYGNQYIPVWEITRDIPLATIAGTGCWVTAIRGHWIFLAFGV